MSFRVFLLVGTLCTGLSQPSLAALGGYEDPQQLQELALSVLKTHATQQL